MRPESRKLLEDMRDAAGEIAAITKNQSLESYLASRQFRWSVERGFEIISFDAEGRMMPYGTREQKLAGPRYLGRPWTDDYSNFLGALR